MDTNDLLIDAELASLLTSHTEIELRLLEEGLRTDGLTSPLLVWPTQGRLVLLDGFARYRLATKLNIAIRWNPVSLPDRNAAVEFRLKQQLARRNLPPIAQAYLRGRLYLLMEKRQGARIDLPKGKADARLTAKGVGERFGLSERTIRRDQRLAEAIDLIGHPDQQGPEFKARLLAGKSNLTRRSILQFAGMGWGERQRLLARLAEERKTRRPRPRRKPPAPRVESSAASNSGAGTPVVRPEAASPEPVPVTQMPAPSRRSDRPTPDMRHVAEAACRLVNPTPAGLPVAAGPVDEGVLEKLTALWRKADHATKTSFLQQPSVQVAIQRLHPSEVRK